MMKALTHYLFLVLFLCVVSISASGQSTSNGIGIGTTSVDESAVLEIVSQSKKEGLLIPRLTHAEMWAISSPAEGLLVYNTSAKELYSYENNRWSSVGTPRGTIIMWSGRDIPYGWALCDGNYHNPRDPMDIGNSPGGNRNVRTPDLRGRFIVGYDDRDSEFNPTAYGQPGTISTGGTRNGFVGGFDRVTLTENQMPSHSHTIQNNRHRHSVNLTGGNHDHEYESIEVVRSPALANRPDGIAADGLIESIRKDVDNFRVNEEDLDYSDAIGRGLIRPNSHTHTGNTGNVDHTHGMDNAGGGQSHENRPPYYVLAYLIKI